MKMPYGLSHSEWKKLADKIRERDNNTCQICGKKGHLLDVHHIKLYRESKNNNPKNLITLCNSCHGKQKVHIRGLTKREEAYFYKRTVGERKNKVKVRVKANNILTIKKIPSLEPLNIPRIEKYKPPKWHLWVYGGEKNPIS